MDQTKELVNTIVEGLQEKKGKNIVTVDLTQLSGAVCQYMVICEGNRSEERRVGKECRSRAKKRARNLCLLMATRVPNG